MSQAAIDAQQQKITLMRFNAEVYTVFDIQREEKILADMIAAEKTTSPAVSRISVPSPAGAAVKPIEPRVAALGAMENVGGDMAKRAAWVKKFEKMPAFSGNVTIAGQLARVVRGSVVVGGVAYQVSKDGRAVVNRNGLLVGEVVGGVMQKPSAAFVAEMAQFGKAY